MTKHHRYRDVYFRLHMAGPDDHYPDLLEVSTFLLDLTTLYELMRLGVRNPEAHFSRFSLYRNRFRVHPHEKLRLHTLRHESPLELVTLFTAAGAGLGVLKGLAYLAESIWGLPLRHRTQALNVRKLELEVRQRELELSELERAARTRELEVEDLEVEASKRSDHFRRVADMEPRLVLQDVRSRDGAQVVQVLEDRLRTSSVKLKDIDIDIVVEELPDPSRR